MVAACSGWASSAKGAAAAVASSAAFSAVWLVGGWILSGAPCSGVSASLWLPAATSAQHFGQLVRSLHQAQQPAQPEPGAPGDFAALIYQQFVRMKRAVVAAKIEVN